MHKKFTIVIATPMTREVFQETETYKSINGIIRAKKFLPYEGIEISLLGIYENKVGLSELYNMALLSLSSDYVVFMHDDVEIHDYFVFEKLIKAHEQYDIVGLAGSKSQDYGKLPAWHLAQQQPSDARGIVAHYIPPQTGVYDAHINSVYFGPTPASVVVIDGLFMSFKKDKIPVGATLFDDDFTFHFYDMAMCVKAERFSLSIGVWPIFVVHHGLGDFNADPLWHKLAIDFKTRYGYYTRSII